MTLLAYKADPDCKQRTMDRLRTLKQAGQWSARPIHWDGRTGSLVGSLLQSEDVEQWQPCLGLPAWLALALDGVLANTPDLAAGIRRAVALLEAVPAGIDLSLAGSRCILVLLLDPAHGLASFAQARAEPLAGILQAVAALHLACLRGDRVEPAEWRRVRRQAVQETDGFAKTDVEAALGAVIEAAAWDPRTSRTAVSDTLRQWAWASSARAARSDPPGWTADDEQRVRQRLEELHRQAKAQALPGQEHEHIDVFKLLREQDPALYDHAMLPGRYRKAQAARQWDIGLDLLWAAAMQGVAPEPPALIPRADLFANPARGLIRISPDGQWLAWLADDEGVMNVWAAPRANPGATRQITFDRRRGIQQFSWSYLPGTLLYAQDHDGDENWRLFAGDAGSGGSRELTPLKPGVRTSIQAVSRVRRAEIVITLNERDPRYPDLYLLELASGKLTLLQENTGFAGYLLDDHYRVRLAARSLADGGSLILRPDADGCWQPWIQLAHEDTRGSGPSHLSADGRTLYFFDSRGRNTAALCAIDLESGETTVLAEDDRADIGGILSDPRDYRPLACGVTYDRYRLRVLDDALKGDVDFLSASVQGEWRLSGHTEDDSLWLINVSSDVAPPAVWLYDRAGRSLTHLLDVRPRLSGVRLARMQPAVIGSRDGLNLVSYLTLPVESEAGELRAAAPLPMVLLVHGGPWSRDTFGYKPMHQWLANRGYAVLSVNFRGSTGFGKAFVNAADGEWGAKMDEDLEDAVAWAVARGIADPARLAIFGGSYGGYAVLSALTRYPQRYACGIDLFGPSSLETLLDSIPAYWEAHRARQYRVIGDPRTEEGKARLRERSPLHHAAAVRAPLLIAQGGNDPRVRQAESEQMVAALRSNGIEVSYALYPDEGHGFLREANRMSFNALCESFLARHLGGRCEPWAAPDFPGSSLQLSEGVGHVEREKELKSTVEDAQDR
ncbi:S9 family peptidase [Acidovorax sp. SDU_ACID1]|uniref:S9 family peptidase n=1 Tax=Acidovorax sp. SDU_ACID1 TaxID=3136632 RepID=UPI00387320F8